MDLVEKKIVKLYPRQLQLYTCDRGERLLLLKQFNRFEHLYTFDRGNYLSSSTTNSFHQIGSKEFLAGEKYRFSGKKMICDIIYTCSKLARFM